MQSIKISQHSTVSRHNGKYFYTNNNQYTGAISTQKLDFNEEGKAEVRYTGTSYGVFDKEKLEISFFVAGYKEEE